MELYLEVREADGSRGKLNQSLDKKCKIYTRNALWYHREMNRAEGQITHDKSKVAAGNLKGTRYERDLLRPVAHLSVARAEYEMSAWGLQMARWTCIIEVKSPFLIIVAQCPVAVRYESLFSRWDLDYKKVHFIRAVWHCARRSFSYVFLLTKFPTSGVTASTASVFTLCIMNDSQSAGEGGSFSCWYT